MRLGWKASQGNSERRFTRSNTPTGEIAYFEDYNTLFQNAELWEKHTSTFPKTAPLILR